MKRIFFALLIAVLCTVTAYGRGHHGPPPPRHHHSHSIIRYDRPPRHYGHHHHHYHGPSRGWYNGLLVTGAILGGLDIITRPFVYERHSYPVYVPSTTVTPIVQQPVVVQPPPAQQPVVTNVTVNVINVNDEKPVEPKIVVTPTPAPVNPYPLPTPF